MRKGQKIESRKTRNEASNKYTSNNNIKEYWYATLVQEICQQFVGYPYTKLTREMPVIYTKAGVGRHNCLTASRRRLRRRAAQTGVTGTKQDAGQALHCILGSHHSSTSEKSVNSQPVRKYRNDSSETRFSSNIFRRNEVAVLRVCSHVPFSSSYEMIPPSFNLPR